MKRWRHLGTRTTHPALSLILLLSSVCGARSADTLTVKYSESKYDSTLYRRVVRYDPNTLTYRVTDAMGTVRGGKDLQLVSRVQEATNTVVVTDLEASK